MTNYQRFEVTTSNPNLSTMIDVPVGKDILAYANESIHWWNSATQQKIAVTSVVFLSTINR